MALRNARENSSSIIHSHFSYQLILVKQIWPKDSIIILACNLNSAIDSLCSKEKMHRARAFPVVALKKLEMQCN